MEIQIFGVDKGQRDWIDLVRFTEFSTTPAEIIVDLLKDTIDKIREFQDCLGIPEKNKLMAFKVAFILADGEPLNSGVRGGVAALWEQYRWERSTIVTPNMDFDLVVTIPHVFSNGVLTMRSTPQRSMRWLP